MDMTKRKTNQEFESRCRPDSLQHRPTAYSCPHEYPFLFFHSFFFTTTLFIYNVSRFDFRCSLALCKWIGRRGRNKWKPDTSFAHFFSQSNNSSGIVHHTCPEPYTELLQTRPRYRSFIYAPYISLYPGFWKPG